MDGNGNNLVTLTINGVEVTVPAGTLLTDAAEQAGFKIPQFCAHRWLEPLGACRMCLVRIEKMAKLQTACSTVVREGMVVTTESMEPTLRVGDLIYVKGVAPAEIKVGDIVTFKPPANYMGGKLVTHRVVEVSYDANEVYFRTKGDNNPTVDPWLIKPSDVIGVQKAVLPGVGRVFLWIRTPSGLAVAGLLLVVYLFWPNIKENLGGFREP